MELDPDMLNPTLTSSGAGCLLGDWREKLRWAAGGRSLFDIRCLD